MVAYILVLPPRLLVVQPIFHVSMFRRYIPNKSHVIPYVLVELGPHLSYEEILVAILDRQLRKLRTKKIASLKVRWQHRPVKKQLGR